MAASVTRTIASLGCSIAGMSFSSTRILYGPRYTIARIEFSPQAALGKATAPWPPWSPDPVLRGTDSLSPETPARLEPRQSPGAGRRRPVVLRVPGMDVPARSDPWEETRPATVGFGRGLEGCVAPPISRRRPIAVHLQEADHGDTVVRGVVRGRARSRDRAELGG